MFYEEVFRKLNQSNIKYLVAGGLAVNLHGVPRMTQDLDLLIDLGKDNILNIIEALKDIGYQCKIPEDPNLFAIPEIREKWKNEKNMKVFSFFHKLAPYQIIDLMFDTPVPFAEASKNKVVKTASDLSIPLVAIPDLIKLKEGTGRMHDQSDIYMLQEILKMETENE